MVVDLCSGSGAIALSVATELPQSTVYCVERDPAALEWLRRNADGHGVTVVAGDVTVPTTLSELDGHVDLVLANPPYLSTATLGSPPLTFSPGTVSISHVLPSSRLTASVGALLQPV